MRPIVLLIALLVASGAAAAQPGPQPGYASATDYAQAYAEERMQNATSDPLDFVGQYDSVEELQAEADHTAYVACWAADDAGLEPDACEPYYTPRGEAMPEQPEEPQEVEDFENATLNATETFVAEAEDAVNDTLADPATAPGQVKRVVDAAQDFLGSIGDAVAALADAIAGGILGTLEGIGQMVGGIESIGIGAANGLTSAVEDVVDGLGVGAATTTDGIAATGIAVGDGMQAATSATGEALSKTGAGIGSAAATAGGAIADAAKATGRGIADGAEAIGDGVSDAAKSVGHGIADAARSVKDTVAGWFGLASAADDLAGTDAGLPVDVDGTAGGLLDDVTGLLA